MLFLDVEIIKYILNKLKSLPKESDFFVILFYIADEKSAYTVYFVSLSLPTG